MLKSFKDRIVSKGARAAVNRYMAPYGRVTELVLDSRRKRIELTVMLKGEREDLHVTVGRYELTQENGRHTLTLHDVVTSREWIDTLAENVLAGRSFDIPPEYAKLLKAAI